MISILAWPTEAQENDWIVVECGGGRVMFSTRLYSGGIPMSQQEVCRCFRRHWKGPECDMEKRRKEWYEWVARKNQEIAEMIDPATVRSNSSSSSRLRLDFEDEVIDTK